MPDSFRGVMEPLSDGTFVMYGVKRSFGAGVPERSDVLAKVVLGEWRVSNLSNGLVSVFR